MEGNDAEFNFRPYPNQLELTYIVHAEILQLDVHLRTICLKSAMRPQDIDRSSAFLGAEELVSSDKNRFSWYARQRQAFVEYRPSLLAGCYM